MDGYGNFFKVIRKIGQIILPRYDTTELIDHSDGKRHIVYVSHHQNMYGVITIMFWLSERIPLRLWAFSSFFSQEETYDQYVNFTLTERFGLPKRLAKIVAWPASYAVSKLANSARCIPVYRKSRKVIKTFKETITALEEDWKALVFPDVDYASDDTEVEDIYEGFLHLEKLSVRETDKHVMFVPILASKKERKIHQAQPIMFDPDVDFMTQRSEIAKEIRNSLNKLAEK